MSTSVLLNLLECEGQNDCANWMFLGGSGTAQWNSGGVANLQVTIRQGNSITIRRTDTNRSVTPGMTAVYQGTIDGNRLEGTVTWTRGAGKNSTTGNWHATFNPPTAAAPSSPASQPQANETAPSSMAPNGAATAALSSAASAPITGATTPQQAAPAIDQKRIPLGFQECDINQCDNGNTGIWIFHGTKGEARWPAGAVAKLEIEQFDANGIVIHRTDTPNSNSPGFTATYEGVYREGRYEGTVSASWPGHFPKGNPPGYIHYPWFATVPQTSCDGNADLTTQDAVETGQAAAKFRQTKAALQCFLIAAKQGDGQAKSYVGLMYRDGIGTEVNYPEAFRWLKASAIQGDYNAQVALSQMYELGIGTQPDKGLAQSWKQQAENNPVIVRQRMQAQQRQQEQQLMFMGFAAVLDALTRPDVVVVY